LTSDSGGTERNLTASCASYRALKELEALGTFPQDHKKKSPTTGGERKKVRNGEECNGIKDLGTDEKEKVGHRICVDITEENLDVNKAKPGRDHCEKGKKKAVRKE